MCITIPIGEHPSFARYFAKQLHRKGGWSFDGCASSRFSLTNTILIIAVKNIVIVSKCEEHVGYEIMNAMSEVTRDARFVLMKSPLEETY